MQIDVELVQLVLQQETKEIKESRNKRRKRPKDETIVVFAVNITNYHQSDSPLPHEVRVQSFPPVKAPN